MHKQYSILWTKMINAIYKFKCYDVFEKNLTYVMTHLVKALLSKFAPKINVKTQKG